MKSSGALGRHVGTIAVTIEAAGMLIAAKVLLRTLAVQRWSRLLGKPTNTFGLDVDGAPAQRGEGSVSQGIDRAARYLPGGFTCLERASAGQFMLRLRGNPGAVVIGLKPAGNGEGHAWLIGKTGVVTGRVEPGEGALTPVSAFR